MQFLLLAFASLYLFWAFNNSGTQKGNFKITEQKYNELASKMQYVEWSESISKAVSAEADEATQTWHLLQRSLGCCGLDSHRNWTSFKPPELPSGFMPSSCCADRTFHDDYLYCSGQIHPGSIYPDCISRAKTEAYEPEFGEQFLFGGLFQLHQAILNIFLSCCKFGRGPSGKADANFRI